MGSNEIPLCTYMVNIHKHLYKIYTNIFKYSATILCYMLLCIQMTQKAYDKSQNSKLPNILSWKWNSTNI